MKQWLFYTPLVWGKTASFGEISGSRVCAPSGSRAELEWSELFNGQGVWGGAAERFLFHNFF